VTQEQPPQMTRRHPERLREVVDAPPVVEKAALDQPQRPRDARSSATPGGRSGRRLGPTAQAGTEPRALGRRRSGEEDHVA